MLSAIVGNVLAVGIGLSLGLIGGGGSILAVPILMYVLGLSPKTAIAMSLIVVGMVSVIGAIPHGRRGNVNLKIAAQFTPFAMVGAWGGSQIAALPQVSEQMQLLAFATVMVLASLLMIRKESPPPIAPGLPAPEPIVPRSRPGLTWVATGCDLGLEAIGVGLVTGFVGVGGGFLIIPALVLVAGVAMEQAIGTSLVIIAINSVTGFLGYLNQVTLDWGLVATFTLAASSGTLAGASLSRRLRSDQLQKGFGYFVLAVAVMVLIKR
ncbi:MAG: sulfite exporter TauE/SafE family protein [Prochlorothrix sp.]|nr:sulfite exporter TauE/SafE family protein [Prochlorothrix sp.]